VGEREEERSTEKQGTKLETKNNGEYKQWNTDLFFFFFFVSLQTSQTAANNNYNSKFSTGIVSIYYRRR
jgi:hypothetical protein